MVNFDGALKDVFQHDQPTLLTRLTGGVPVRAFLNVELPKVQDRRVDLLLSLADDTLLHIEVQSSNDVRMPYRMVEYWAAIKRRFQRPLRQVVLYVGRHSARMRTELAEDGLQFSYELKDIRGFSAETLLRTGNQGDLALALLAKDGPTRLRQILHRATELSGPARQQLISKIAILSGLRGMSGRVEWELEKMGVIIDPRKNVILMRLEREALARGEARGAAKFLRKQLTVKFGPLPKWAADRVKTADSSQMEKWCSKVLTARTLEGVVGKSTTHSRRTTPATRKP